MTVAPVTICHNTNSNGLWSERAESSELVTTAMNEVRESMKMRTKMGMRA